MQSIWYLVAVMVHINAWVAPPYRFGMGFSVRKKVYGMGVSRLCKQQAGAGEGTRTLDILLGRQMLYQLSYTRANGHTL